ncbi:MAG TPA: tetratricopeptide repeat protein, partial [Chitinophagaceae bacterium]
MKKTALTFLMAGILSIAGLKAQTLQEGINHLYADRFKSAIGVFEKLLAANPNNIEATYWLGQAYFDMDEYAGSRLTAARQLYEKALQTSANAPLILVGMGHVELKEGKTNEARQKFESALTATRGKKGDDPVILNAIGRANVDAKQGDLAYAIQKLEAAALRDDKNPDIFLNLGNAYRKAKPGEGGGDAYKNYHKALAVNPNFSRAYVRLAALFEAQKNWELMFENLTKSVEVDPKFTKGYYELFYYYWWLKQDYAQAETQLNKYIESKSPETDIQDQYMYAQLCYGKKDYACAVTKAQSVVAALGDKTKPKVYRLLAYANYDKGDYNEALKNSNIFFQKKNPGQTSATSDPDEVIAKDYKLKADILSKTGGTPDEILNTYVTGAALDTVLTSKADFLKQGVKYFKDNKIWDKAATLADMVLQVKPKPTLPDHFDITMTNYFAKFNDKSRQSALKLIDIYPNEIYGYLWAFNNSRLMDTVKKDSIAVPDALKLYDFTQKDTTKFKKEYITAVSFLAGYYINDAKDKEKSLEFFRKWLQID